MVPKALPNSTLWTFGKSDIATSFTLHMPNLSHSAIHTLAQTKVAQARIVQLDHLMEKAQAKPRAWKSLGCPGTRYLPEWEKLMHRVTVWMGRNTTTNDEIYALSEYETELRKGQPKIIPSGNPF